jgi:hypothetical protein
MQDAGIELCTSRDMVREGSDQLTGAAVRPFR